MSSASVSEAHCVCLDPREGRSNAHVKGDYQRIGDIMLRNMCSLKVRFNNTM